MLHYDWNTSYHIFYEHMYYTKTNLLIHNVNIHEDFNIGFSAQENKNKNVHFCK